MAQPSTGSAETTAFAPQRQVRSIADVRALEAGPLEEAVTAHSTYAILRNAALSFGDRVALTFLPSAEPGVAPIRWTFAELLARVHQTANALHTLGVGPQDAVAALLPGCLEYQLAHWGVAAAGIAQPLNPLLTLDKLASLMNAADAKVLIAWGADEDAGYWTKAMALRERVPSLRHVLRVAPPGEANPRGLPEGVVDFARLLAGQPDTHLTSGRAVRPTDIAAYFHTGGTTGAPKLARHSHAAQVFTAWACVQLQGMNPDDVVINGYPLFHVAGVLPGALAALASGVETIVPTTRLYRDPVVIRNFWRLIEHHRVTVLSAVPTVLAALAQVPLDGADISSLRYCRTGAAILPPELAARFERELGLHIHESLGMTEMAGISSITPLGVQAPPGCVGFRLPYSQVRVVALDAQGGASDQDLPVGQSGMLLFKSPNLFSGFLDASDTARAFTADGWLATGDLGFIDGEERIHLSGRSKDLIIRSGHNIDPKTIEDALGAHPAVQLCAAVGAPDAYAGELPVVFATLVPGRTVDAAELLDFASARVDEGPARPKQVHLIETMPMTNVGKIYKPALRAQAAGHVVRALIAPLCADLPAAQQPQLDCGEDGSVSVRLPAAAPAALVPALQQRLAPLPIKTQVTQG